MITLATMKTRNGKTRLRYTKGHFATNHSHINYYVDITYQKTRLSEAKESAYELVSHFVNDTPVDICYLFQICEYDDSGAENQ